MSLVCLVWRILFISISISCNSVRVVKFDEFECAVLFESIRGVGVLDEYCKEKRLKVVHLCIYIEMTKILVYI